MFKALSLMRDKGKKLALTRDIFHGLADNFIFVENASYGRPEHCILEPNPGRKL